MANPQDSITQRHSVEPNTTDKKQTETKNQKTKTKQKKQTTKQSNKIIPNDVLSYS